MMELPFSTIDWLPKEEQVILRALQESPMAGESALIDNRMFWSEAAFDRARDQRTMARDLNSIYKHEVDEWEREVRPTFKLINLEGQETIDFHLGHQWTPEDEAAHFDRGAKPYVLNDFRQYVNAVLAEGISRKAALRVTGRTPASQERAEFCNRMLQWVWIDNNLDRVNFLVRRDALLYGVGFWGVSQDPMDPFGRIRIRHVKPMECMWDIDTATESCIGETRRFMRMRYATRAELIAEFPEWKNEIADGAASIMATSGWEDEYAMARPKVSSQIGYREHTQEMRSSRIFGDLLFVREYYRRRWEPRYVVVDPFTHKTYPYTTPQGAATKTAELRQAYMQVGVDGEMGDQLFAPRTVQKAMVDQLVFIGSQLVRFTPTEDDHIPYVDYAPELYNGEVTPYFSHLKGPQRWKNKIASYAEEISAQTKGGTIVNMKYKPQNMSEQDFMDFINGVGWKLPVNESAPEYDPSKVVHNTGDPRNGQMFASMLPVIQGQLDRSGGGPNGIGIAAFAGQSGDMAEQLQVAGSKLTRSVFEVERASLTTLGEKILYFSGFLHPAIQMRAYDEGLTPTFFSMLSENIRSMKDYHFDVHVTQVVGSDSERAAQFKQLTALAGYLPQQFHHFADAILQTGDLDYSLRKKIVESITAEAEGTRREAQVKLRAEIDQADRKTAVQEAGMIIRARQQAFAEKNAPSIIGSLDLNKTPPMILSTILNWASQGIGQQVADPSYLMMDRALQSAQDEERLVTRQQNYNDNLLPEEREAMKPPKKPVATPKDVSNRATREVMAGD